MGYPWEMSRRSLVHPTILIMPVLCKEGKRGKKNGGRMISEQDINNQNQSLIIICPRM